MKQLKELILISCLLFIFNGKTAHPLQLQENKQDQTSLNIENVDITDEHTEHINMNEETFMNLLNADFNNLSLIEGIWSNEKNTYKIGIQKAEGKDKYVAFILNSREPTMNQGEIIAEFIETRYEHIYSTEYYLEDKTKIVTRTYIDDQEMLLIFLEKWGKEDAAFIRNFPIKEATEEEEEKKEKVSDVKQSLAKEDEAENDKFYVQVGAWKNHNYAQKLFGKLKIYYPDAYIVVQNNFNKIRIPGVMTKKQGAIMSRDIEKKFNLKPIVVLGYNY